MPGLFDLQAEKLATYQGTNPRPSDFDLFWDTALAESLVAPLDVELVPNKEISTRSAECFNLWFSGADGARVHAKFLRPRNRTTRCAAVLEFHGYSSSSYDWCHKLALVSEGFCVASLDCRGQGGMSQDVGVVSGNTLSGHIVRGVDDPDPRKLYYRQMFLDTERLARAVASFPEVDASRIVSTGHSQGGGLALACAALTPLVKRCAAVFPFLCDYKRVWEMDMAKGAYEEIGRHFRTRDPQHLREEAFFLRLGYIDVQHLAQRVRAETLMITGLQDTICPPSTQFAAYNKIRAPKHVVLFPEYAHECPLGAHDLIFNHLTAV